MSSDELPAFEFSLPPSVPQVATPSYDWPAPPNFRFAAQPPQNEAEPCAIHLLDGSLLQGIMTFFVPDSGSLQLQMPPSRTTITIRFDKFKRLSLNQPRAATAASSGIDASLQPAPEKQPFSITYPDGEVFSDETVGYVQKPFGLFLFLPNEKVDAVRCVFVPATAQAKFSIGGGPIGEYLVSENLVPPEHVDTALETQKNMREQKIGEFLVDEKILTPEALMLAIKKQGEVPVMRLGETLIELGLLTQAQLKDSLEKQRTQRAKPLGKILVEQGFIDDQTLQVALARKMGFPLVDVATFPIEKEALQAVPYAIAVRQNVLPLVIHTGVLIVALEDPWRGDAIEEVKFITQMKVVPVMAPSNTLTQIIRDVYTSRHDPWQKVYQLETTNDPPQLDQLPLTDVTGLEQNGEEEIDDTYLKESDEALVRLVNTMIVDAFSQNTTDIHIEANPEKQKVRIRFRKDGLLSTYLELSASYRRAIIARLKVMAELDTRERQKSQSGKINFARFGPAKIELRVASIPTTNGLEDMVLHILSSAKPVPMENLGFNAYTMRHVQQIMQRPYGLFLLCGPIGSGKTTTLHSCLSYINVPERKIWTAEDPVEITQPGLRQVQINPKVGWTYASALKAFLRADPDVIMAGEIRDEETARLAIEAALTGDLVLSSLHTYSAAEGITRLLDMGIDPFNYADALLGLLGQRLVRRLCPDCRSSRPATEEEIKELLEEYLYGMPKIEPLNPQTLLDKWRKKFANQKGELLKHHSPGCETCSGTGYKGRIGIHEMLVVTREIRRLIQTRAGLEKLQPMAIQQGMLTLKQDGIYKIWAGLTDLHEVRSASPG